MRTVIFLAALFYFCNPAKAQYKYYQYKDMAVLYDSVKKSIRYYYDEKGSMESFKFFSSYELNGLEPSDMVNINIAANDQRNVTVVAFDGTKKENQVYKVWKFTCNKTEFKNDISYTFTFDEAPVFRGFSWGGIGFIIKKKKRDFLVNGPNDGNWEKLPDNRATFETNSGISNTIDELAYIDDEDSRKAKENALYEARVQEAVKRNKEAEDMEAVRKKQKDSIQNAEFQKNWAAQQRAEDSLRKLPPGIRIENSTNDLIYCLNAWANQFKDRTDIVTKIASCKNSSSSCMVDNYIKLKRLFSDLRDRLSTTSSKMSRDYTSAWDQCDSARKYYSQGTNLLDKAYTSFNSAYEAARKISENYNSMTDADYNLWVQVMFRSYDEGDVFVQDAYYYLYSGYDRYLGRKCPSLKQGALAKDGNVLLQTLVGWQPILKQKFNDAEVQRANNEKNRKEALAKAADAKKKEGNLCPNCHGSGVEQVFEKCIICGGDGLTTAFKTGSRKVGDKAVYKKTDASGTETYEIRDVNVTTVEGKETVTCSVCHGKGGKYTKKTRICHVCHGAKKI